jgi:hypothetical protein
MFTGIARLLTSIGSLPKMFWGMTLLYSSMYIAVKYNASIGYYFAGVATMMLGLNHVNKDGSDAGNSPS